ncbi:MAG TPA: LPS export ABC transporter periplasmic protein LptC, partial [Terriglobales bacterium]|nr:LPS export ABC transporter periplasmic protein LptC [Terriglobales bacterium]
RLQLWLAISGLLLIAIVAGFLAYGRYRTRQIVRSIPQKLGANIQQTAQGFTYSQSEGGRTLFTIHASQMVQFREGGHTQLKDVNIIIYGRDSSRFDQIYGSGFEYDPQQRIVRAGGEVHIDLQADAEGTQHPDQAPPQELKNPIHVKTSGLEFDEKTGIARTDQELEFRTPQASGSAKGAVYDSRQRMLTLKSEVHLVTQSSSLAGAQFASRSKKGNPIRETAPAEVRASSAVLRNENRTAALENVTATRGPETLRARNVLVAMRDDSTVERVIASGDVEGRDAGARSAKFTSSRAELLFNNASTLIRTELTGGATFESAGARPMHGSAGRVLANFGANNTLQTVHADQSVDLVEEAPAAATQKRAPSSGSTGSEEDQRAEVKAPILDVFTRQGKSLDHAIATGPSQVLITQADRQRPGTGASSTTISATQLKAMFDEQNHLKIVHGDGDAASPVKVVSTTTGQPDRTTTSRTLDAAFTPGTTAISSITQSGEFNYREGTRTAAADQAHFAAATNQLSLSGKPRYADEQVQLESDALTLNRTSGEVRAHGDVKTTYLPQNTAARKPAADAMFSGSSPVHVTSHDLVAQRAAGTALFDGGARLWQGADLVAAPTIQFDRAHRSVDAQGQIGRPVASVFVQNGKDGRVVPVNVTAARLTYAGTDNRARFSGGVTVRSADATMNADHVDVLLKANTGAAQSNGQTVGSTAQQNSGPAQVERIIADGGVTIVQPGRRATGQKLVYVAADQSFTLTGGPPSIFDAERGQITGNSLTFYTQGDRVLVENPANGGAKRTVIHTRVTK